MQSEMIDAAACDAEYRRLGYDAGYIFGMTPIGNLDTAEVILVGLNPGGEWGEDMWEVASGNGYLGEQNWSGVVWRNPLESEVSALFELLAVKGDQIFAGQFIPFRSRSFDELTRQDEAIAFGRRLWTWALSRAPAKLIVCMGQKAAWHISNLIGAEEQGDYPTGWGTTAVRRYVAPDGRVVISIPHPSWYKLLGPGRDPVERRAAKLAILTAAQPIDEGSGHG